MGYCQHWKMPRSSLSIGMDRMRTARQKLASARRGRSRNDGTARR